MTRSEATSESQWREKNEKELHTHINEAIITPELRKSFRKNLINLEIGKPLEGTSRRIVEALKSF